MWFKKINSLEIDKLEITRASGAVQQCKKGDWQKIIVLIQRG